MPIALHAKEQIENQYGIANSSRLVLVQRFPGCQPNRYPYVQSLEECEGNVAGRSSIVSPTNAVLRSKRIAIANRIVCIASRNRKRKRKFSTKGRTRANIVQKCVSSSPSIYHD